jgi:excinuclease UvrABC nuclease subunit
MSDEFICWNCNHALINVILPMSRREECDKCKADQHVCKMCLYYAKGRCEEERAEHISNTERANFCDYFKPCNAVFKTSDKQKSDKAKALLAELFGDTVDEQTPSDENLSPWELAEKKCREMLGG